MAGGLVIVAVVLQHQLGKVMEKQLGLAQAHVFVMRLIIDLALFVAEVIRRLAEPALENFLRDQQFTRRDVQGPL